MLSLQKVEYDREDRQKMLQEKLSLTQSVYVGA